MPRLFLLVDPSLMFGVGAPLLDVSVGDEAERLASGSCVLF